MTVMRAGGSHPSDKSNGCMLQHRHTLLAASECIETFITVIHFNRVANLIVWPIVGNRLLEKITHFALRKGILSTVGR